MADKIIPRPPGSVIKRPKGSVIKRKELPVRRTTIINRKTGKNVAKSK